MNIYPEAKPEVEVVPDLTEVEKEALVDEMVRLTKEGPPLGYFPEGVKAEFNAHHVISEATNKIMGDRKYYPQVRILLGVLLEEVREANTVSVADCKTEVDYKTAVKEKLTYLNETLYVEGKLAEVGVDKYEDLKTKLDVRAPIE